MIIIVKFNDKVIERVVTEKKRISIGRTNENDIVLENRGVSRKHAMIEFNNNAAVIMDNESLNGTFVNDRKISEEILRNGDVITIGKYTLIFNPQTEIDIPSIIPEDGNPIKLDREVTTFGKAKFVHVPVKGFRVSDIQAKIVHGEGKYTIINIGRRGKVKVNGESIDDNPVVLKNGDKINVGNSEFEFKA